MSGVLLRCSRCGTTQGHPGECETCFEGEVRYFCSNHADGRWLDGPTCNVCGAKFGEAPPRAPATPPPGSTARPRQPARPAPPSATPDARSRGPSPRRPETRDRAFKVPDLGRRAPARVPAEDDGEEKKPSLAEVLIDMIEEGERTRRAGDAAEPRWSPPAEAPRPALPVLGCLTRLVVLVLLAVGLVIFGLFLWAGLAVRGSIG